MKFLCTNCDSVLKMKDAVGPDRGSVALIYACDTCDTGFAMLTNPHETQAVTSLGVNIGPADDSELATAASKCPFNGMLQDMGVDMNVDLADAQSASDDGSAVAVSASETGEVKTKDLVWSAAAKSRLELIPSFVRPMAVDGIETYARDHGFDEVTEQVLDAVRENFVV